ncbi:hypothetical protein DL770_011430 [Monosporascus sp. CRB-9-2]|nr:hypothetical protein DL770_011430 [Monosporascus sp. CRB-9-2]
MAARGVRERHWIPLAQRLERLGKIVRGATWHGIADALVHQLAQAARCARDDRHAAGHRFQRDEAERFLIACMHENIDTGHGGGQVLRIAFISERANMFAARRCRARADGD